MNEHRAPSLGGLVRADMVTKKRCSKCGELKLLCEFGKNSTNKDKLRYHCRSCIAAYDKACYIEHRDEIIARVKRYSIEHQDAIIKRGHEYYQKNKDWIAIKGRQYRIKNRDQCLARCQRYYSEHTNEKAIYKREWHNNNPMKAHASRVRRRARKLAATVENLDEQAVWNYWGPMCAYCGATDGEMALDHIVPLSRGGSHSFDNLCVACKSCNSSKGAKTLIQWMLWKCNMYTENNGSIYE